MVQLLVKSQSLDLMFHSVETDYAHSQRHPTSIISIGTAQREASRCKTDRAVLGSKLGKENNEFPASLVQGFI